MIPFGHEVANHHNHTVSLHIGPSAWIDASIGNLANRGSVLVLPSGTNADEWSWPIWDRMIAIKWPGCNRDQFDSLATFLLSENADGIVGSVNGRLVISMGERRDTIEWMWKYSDDCRVQARTKPKRKIQALWRPEFGKNDMQWYEDAAEQTENIRRDVAATQRDVNSYQEGLWINSDHTKKEQ